MTALVGVILMTLAMQGPVETIALDSMSHVEEARQVAAKTQKEWDTLWRLHAGDKPAPKVDLAKRTVVAVFLGTRPTAGYRVEITGTRPEGKTLVVEWREGRPDPGGILAQVITSPAHIASIPRFDGEIVFRKADR